MRKLLDSIAIRNLNTVQRSGYFVTIVSCLVLIALHNPMSPYDIYKPKGGNGVEIYNWNKYTSPVTGKTHLYDGNATEECWATIDLYYSVEAEPYGSPEKERVENEALAAMKRLDCDGNWFKAFSEWRTYFPLVAWLGNVVNLLFSIFSVLGVGCFWLFVFRTTKPVGADD